MQGNIKTLTDALSTAQALHAGTIQERLIEQVDGKSEEVAVLGEPPKHWWQRIFKKR